jgi:ribosomal protein S18 acetylase RimI-like enzyme
VDIVTLTDPRAFAAVQGDGAEAFERQLRALADDGRTRPEWWFVARDGGQTVGRVAFTTDERVDLDDRGARTGDPPTETALAGLWLRWRQDDVIVGPRLLATTVPRIAHLGPPVDARVNAEIHEHVDRRRTVLEAAGFGLFQEKIGFVWRDQGQPIVVPDRLTYRSLAATGRDAFVDALARAGDATLDRNDRYYLALVGARRWGEEMMGYLEEGDERSWRLAYDARDELVGYVMLSVFDEEDVGTVTHIGVLPEHRGNGYAGDLLQRATLDARDRGLREILSDVDTENGPMQAAMERGGHMQGVRPWRVWHYRFPAPATPST